MTRVPIPVVIPAGATVVELARGWIGTPYRHGASCRGAGCDCLGLILGLWREAGGAPPDPPPYAFDWAEAGGAETLRQAAVRHLRPASSPAAGDILLFRIGARGPAKHLGLSCGPEPGDGFIHAYAVHGVVESPLSAPWRRRLVARFAFPEGDK